jgi:hypothetical protein
MAPIIITDYGSGTLPIFKSTEKKNGLTLFLLKASYVIIQNFKV